MICISSWNLSTNLFHGINSVTVKGLSTQFCCVIVRQFYMGKGKARDLCKLWQTVYMATSVESIVAKLKVVWDTREKGKWDRLVIIFSGGYCHNAEKFSFDFFFPSKISVYYLCNRSLSTGNSVPFLSHNHSLFCFKYNIHCFELIVSHWKMI